MSGLERALSAETWPGTELRNSALDFDLPTPVSPTRMSRRDEAISRGMDGIAKWSVGVSSGTLLGLHETAPVVTQWECAGHDGQ